MREVFVSDLVKEVLGPRGGMHEILEGNPLDEYITGVLAPAGLGALTRDMDNELDIPAEGLAEDREDEEVDSPTAQPSILAPALDPRARPHSIGLSFVIETGGTPPSLDICITWARYEPAEAHKWRRVPRWALLEGIQSTARYSLRGDGTAASSNETAEASLHVSVDPRNSARFLVRIHLVNTIRLRDNAHAQTDEYLFQPQIRVACRDGTRVVPDKATARRSGEDEELDFLHRERPVLARGYLCSAVWHDIDPETRNHMPVDYPNVVHEPPFSWVDGDLLPQSKRAGFSPASVRTEFVPMYLVQGPQIEWDSSYGPPPELNAENLAELWDPSELSLRLRPLVDAYYRWIDQLVAARGSLTTREQVLAERLIDRCRAVAGRIARGIELLEERDDIRLCFCFAMKVMALQASWPRRRTLVWRPFQLAFILMTLESIVDPGSAERSICDLLWVPTGSGKTEAYLAIAAFTLAYRRRRALGRSPGCGDRTGAGVAVISRYTLRLLTIQQFRRTLKMITACEYLRVSDLCSGKPVGWRPSTCNVPDDFLWGSSRFSIGLWVGGGVTPNHLDDRDGGRVRGALSVLKGDPGQGEPAQVLDCPACGSILSVPDSGLLPGDHVLHLAVTGCPPSSLVPSSLSHGNITVRHVAITPVAGSRDRWILSVKLSCPDEITPRQVDQWWNHVCRRVLMSPVELLSHRASRPGYYARWYATARRGRPPRVEYDFELFCPNPECPLHRPWCEGMPGGWVAGSQPGVLGPTGGVAGIPNTPDGNRLTEVCHVFRTTSPYVADRIPVPAYTVDEQIYHRCPSVVIATVDKFARPAFEPRAAALFGNVRFHHCIWGYYRMGQHAHGSADHPSPYGSKSSRNYVSVPPLEAPDLILQDELHLIEGPLGSLVGVYEMAVDHLCVERSGTPVKYIASTATVKNAVDQVKAVFCRELAIFPPPGLTIDDRFFLRGSESHPLNDRNPGRLYVGVCAPGRGPLTPIVRIWARLLNTAWEERRQNGIDPFWTLTGYFNAVRELAGARALYRQDIRERLNRISRDPAGPRPIGDEACKELSSRQESTELPSVLSLLERSYPDAQDALFTTSMFGTGVDVSRIGLMVVHGQPKTTSSYIQATGRVGRSRGALVVTFLRASRPRDLSHYEFFCGYHRQLDRFVEAITVTPFAPGAVARATGPVAVFILRNMMNPLVPWDREGSAVQMATNRLSNEVQNIIDLAERRACQQPLSLAPPRGDTRARAQAALDDWARIASQQQTLQYVEYVMSSRQVSHPVVLGDAAHQHAGLRVVFENVPQSLREIEETCSFQAW